MQVIKNNSLSEIKKNALCPCDVVSSLQINLYVSKSKKKQFPNQISNFNFFSAAVCSLK